MKQKQSAKTENREIYNDKVVNIANFIYKRKGFIDLNLMSRFLNLSCSGIERILEERGILTKREYLKTIK